MKNPALSKTHRYSVPPEQPPSSGAQQGTLTLLAGQDVGAIVELSEERSLIGRSTEATLRLDSEGVSRAHACILRKGKTYTIQDLGSTNGTYVDGLRIDRPVTLRDGIRIQIGTTLMRFSLQDTLEQEAARRTYEMSVRDGLTGLYNRRHFDERLSAEHAFAIRHRTALAVLVIDVDHFKRINDQWGHPAGDAVLQALGRALHDSLRSEDLVARFGGEEFAILCRGIDVEGVRALGERVRRMVESMRIPAGGMTIKITASIGVAHNDCGAARAEQLVASADAALYAAKRGGRNRVTGPLAGGRYSIHGAEAEESIHTRPAQDAPRRTWDGDTRPTRNS